MVFFFSPKATAQDPVFSQFYANPLYLNPAFTGVTHSPRFHINFRDQWPAISHAYVSYSASYDQFFEELNSGIGVLVLGDNAGNGMFSTMMASFIYSYQINFSDAFAMKVGLQGSYIQKRIDITKLFFYDQIDPVTGFYTAGNTLNPTSETSINNTRVAFPDASAGVLAFTRRFFFGGSVMHVTQPQESFTGNAGARLPARITVHAGGRLGELQNTSGGVAVSPNVLYTQQGQFKQLNGGTFFRFGHFISGVHYRYNFGYSDAVILLLGGQKGIMQVGYSYDITLQELAGHSGGAHELSVMINLDESENKKRRRALHKSLKCPSLF